MLPEYRASSKNPSDCGSFVSPIIIVVMVYGFNAEKTCSVGCNADAASWCKSLGYGMWFSKNCIQRLLFSLVFQIMQFISVTM